MSLPSEESSISYVGNASTSTPYPIPFKFYTGENIAVVVTGPNGIETTLTPITDYTVTGGDAEAGAVGNLTTSDAVTSSSSLLISRTVEIVQDTSFTDIGKFPSSAVDRALDYLTMICQQLYRQSQDFIATLFASDQETIDGNLTNKATTPHGVRSAIVAAVYQAGSFLLATVQECIDGLSALVAVTPFGLRGAMNDRLTGGSNLAFSDPVSIDDGGECSTLMLPDGVTMMRWRREGAVENAGPVRVTWQTCPISDPVDGWTTTTDCVGFPTGEGWFPFVFRLKDSPIFYCSIKLSSSLHGNRYMYSSVDGKTWTVMNSGQPYIIESSDPTNLNSVQYNTGLTQVGEQVYVFVEGTALQPGVGYNYSDLSYLALAQCSLANFLANDLSEFQATLTQTPVFQRGIGAAPMPVWVPERNAVFFFYGFSGSQWPVGPLFDITLKVSTAPDTADFYDADSWRQCTLAFPNVVQASDPDLWETPIGVLSHFNLFQNTGYQAFTNASSFANLYDRLLNIDFSQQDLAVNTITAGKPERNQWIPCDIQSRQDHGEVVGNFYNPWINSGHHSPYEYPRYPSIRLGRNITLDCFWSWDSFRNASRLGVGHYSETENYNKGRVELEGWANKEAFAKTLYPFTGGGGITLDAATTSPYGTGDFTVSFLLNPTTNNGLIQYITTGAGALEISIEDRTMHIGKGGDGASIVDFDNVVAYNELHLYTLIRRDGSLYLYRDGKQMFIALYVYFRSFTADITAAVATIGGAGGNFLIGYLSRYTEAPFAIGDDLRALLVNNGGLYTPLQRGTIAANNILNLGRNSTFAAGATDWENAGTAATVAVVSSKLHITIPSSDDAARLQSTYFGGDFDPGKTYSGSMDISGFANGATIRIFAGGQNQSIADRPNPNGTISFSFTSIGGGTGLLITVLGNVSRTFDVDNVAIRSVATSYEMEDGCDNAGRQIADLSGHGRLSMMPLNESVSRASPSPQGRIQFAQTGNGYVIANERIVPDGYIVSQAAIEGNTATASIYNNSGGTITIVDTAPANKLSIGSAVGFSTDGKLYIGMASQVDVTGAIFLKKM